MLYQYISQVQLTKSTSITVTDHIRVVVTTVYDSREEDIQLRGLDGANMTILLSKLSNCAVSVLPV